MGSKAVAVALGIKLCPDKRTVDWTTCFLDATNPNTLFFLGVFPLVSLPPAPFHRILQTQNLWAARTAQAIQRSPGISDANVPAANS